MTRKGEKKATAKATPARASVGVALIARNAAHTLGACLDSIRPYVQQIVVGVDELTTDDTWKVAKQHGAQVFPVKVSDWHECDAHGRVLAQHFAEARTASFQHLDPSLDWWMWLDADDVVAGAEHLAALLAGVPDDVIGVWLPYHYGQVQGQTNTLFHRERILRASVGWSWQYRVHEVVTPHRAGPWLTVDTVRVVHQEGGHKSESSATRNLLLQEIGLEETPNDARLLFYQGNQHFALGKWEQAAYWYEQLAEVGQNPYELWQGYCYLSMALSQLGDLDGALKAAFGAIDVIPTHPEPYLQVAAIYGSAGEDAKCVHWTAEARRRTEPPFFVFKNPLDLTFNARVKLADALVRLGRVPDALAELEQAYAALPDPRVGEAIAHYKALERDAHIASAYAALATPMGDAAKVALWEALDLPPSVRQFGRARDVVMPALLRQRPNTQPRIVFWCGRSFEEWYPGTLASTGIGGSETAVVEIAKRFAAAGWRADVYNGAGRYEGVYDGVGYWEPERWQRDERGDLFVGWRQPSTWTLADPGFRQHVLWCHDLNYGRIPDEDMLAWHTVLGVSQWHADYLRQVYDVEADFVPNGVDLARFAPETRKVPWSAIYASSPDRGLERLLHLWPKIAEGEPSATLTVAYGFENLDKQIAAGRADLGAWKDRLVRLMEQTPGVAFVGRLPQDELARRYSETAIWAYPSHFLEVSCISAMEALAGGCVPVTAAAGALKETIGGYGVVVPGQPHSRAWQDFFVLSAKGVLADPNVRMPLSLNGPTRAAELTWDKAFSRWDQIVNGLLSSDRAAVAV